MKTVKIIRKSDFIQLEDAINDYLKTVKCREPSIQYQTHVNNGRSWYSALIQGS